MACSRVNASDSVAIARAHFSSALSCLAASWKGVGGWMGGRVRVRVRVR